MRLCKAWWRVDGSISGFLLFACTLDQMEIFAALLTENKKKMGNSISFGWGWDFGKILCDLLLFEVRIINNVYSVEMNLSTLTKLSVKLI